VLRNFKRKLLHEPLEPRMLLDGNSLVISEFMADNETTLADEDGQFRDWVEIHNPTAEAISLDGWYLTDATTALTQWRFPDVTLQPNGYRIVFASGKNRTDSLGELHTNFRLANDGEYLALVRPDEVTVEFAYTARPQFDDVSYGLGSDMSARGYLITPTPELPNVGEPVDDPTHQVVISEIMYHPAIEDYDPVTGVVLNEYIELYNRGNESISLAGWRISNGVAFTFSDDPATEIVPGEYLVVAADVDTFGQVYAVEPETTVLGGWTGRLSNSGETIELVDAVGRRADRVRYADEGDWSIREEGPEDLGHTGWVWANDHDGGGASLELINTEITNEHGQNWAASDSDQGPTPGAANSMAAEDVAPMILDVSHSPAIPRSSDPVTVIARVIDEAGPGVAATVYYRDDGQGSFEAMAMLDDGQSGDGEADDGIYGAVLPARPNGTVVEFYIGAADQADNQRTCPAPARFRPTGGGAEYGQLTNLLYQVDDTYDAEAVWDPNSQPIYHLVMTEAGRAELENIGDHSGSDFDSNAQMNGAFVSLTGTGVQVRQNVGIRNRGKGTRNNPPNNYRVNFPHDRPWHGVTAINVNSKYTPLQVAASAVFRMAGLPAEDGAAVQVRVNGENLAETGSRMYGSYAHLQTLDSDFADRQFPNDPDGNIYRCVSEHRYTNLDYLGTDPQDYIDAGYLKNTNSGENDWSDLIRLTDVLNNAPDATYAQEVEEVVNVDQWLRWFAVSTLIGNNETNLANGYGDDYSMYRGVEDPRFLLLAHDLDTTFGLGDNGADTDDSIFEATGEDAIERFITHPAFAGRYYAQLKDLIETVFSPQEMEPLLNHALSSPTLGSYVPASTIGQMLTWIEDRCDFVLSVIPDSFTITPSLPIVDGYYQTGSGGGSLQGTAAAAETRSVLVNGMPADFSPMDGTWSLEVTPGGSFSDTLVAAGDPVTYHVPTAEDDLLAWTETDFTASISPTEAWSDTSVLDGAGVLITEVSTGEIRSVEIENVSREPIDTGGWQVLVNDASAGNINAVDSVAWSLPDSIIEGEVLYRADDVEQPDHYWGGEIFWDPDGPGWTMIVDPSGNVMDVLVWGYTEAEIAAVSLDFGPWTGITVAEHWSGPGAEVGTVDTGEPVTGGFVAFNDHVRGTGTHADTTTYTPNGTPAGLLKDVETGQFTDVTLTTSENGVSWQGTQGEPAPGTDAYEIFDGYVDFSGGSTSGASIAISDDDDITHTFSGLDTGEVITYDFSGTAVRGGSDYDDRWTCVTLQGADSATAAHSTGEGVIVLSPTEVAIWTGENHRADQGFVAAWTEIDPGADGEFSIVSNQYVGNTPFGVSDGSKGYGISGVRLEEVTPQGPLSWLKRSGNADGNSAADFARDDQSGQGVENDEMAVPFGHVVDNVQGVGFHDNQPEFEAIIGTDVAAAMHEVNASLWSRIEFVSGDPSVYDTLTLRMNYDDGFVAYLNGVKVAEKNAENPLAYDMTASAEHADPEAVVFEDIDISDSLHALQPGVNVLAIRGLNLAADDADFLIRAELIADGTVPATGLDLYPGINRVTAQAFDGEHGTGNELDRAVVDIWYEPGAYVPIIPPGPVSGVWDRAVYYVTGDIEVPAGETLTIMPGTTVYFSADSLMTVHGRLLAEGTGQQRILLTKDPDGGAWDGIDFDYDSYSDQVNRITYTDFDYSDGGSEAILMHDAQLVLENVDFTNHGKQYLDMHGSSIIVRNSTFPDAAGELIHYLDFPDEGYAIFDGNYFGRAAGYNDVIDFTGGQRPGPIMQVTNNYFSGAGDDGLDLDSTDAHIEGNIFVDFHQDGSRASKSHAIATGNDTNEDAEVTIVRNLFYDVDHAVVIKDGAFGTIVNNTIVKVYKKYTSTDATTAAINFFEDRPPQYEGNGVYLDGNIFYDVSALFEHAEPVARPVAVTMNNCIVYPATAGEPVPWVGTGNMIGVDPRLTETVNVTDPVTDFILQAGSPAFGAGPNGVDIGGSIPAGASIAGEPSGVTPATFARLTVGGPHLYGYKYRLNNGPWSTERAVLNTVASITRSGATATVAIAGHGYAEGDTIDLYGSQQLEYSGTFTIANATADTFEITVAGTPVSPATGNIVCIRQEPIELTGLADGDYTVYVIDQNSAGVWRDEADAVASQTWTVDTSKTASELAELQSLAVQYADVMPELSERVEGWSRVIASAGSGTKADASAKDAQEIPGGTITVDTILTPQDGPYQVTGDVTVPAGVTLTIEPGTTLFFDQDTGIRINGRLLAEGTEYQRIRLTRLPGSGATWDGLSFNSAEDNRLTCTDMEYSTAGSRSISLSSSKILIDNVTWTGTTETILNISNSSLIVRNSVFPDTSAQAVSGHRLLASDPYMLFENNVFGVNTGTKQDVLDFSTTGAATMPRFIGNLFLGGGDDALDQDGTDSYVEGNVFMNFHRNFDPTEGESYAVSSGYDGGYSSHHVIVRNLFVDCDTAALVKDRSWIAFENNTLVRCGVGINFDEPQEAGIDPGVGAYLDGNIFFETPTPLAHFYVDDPTWGTTDITVNRSILPAAYHDFGVGNIDADPRLAGATGDDFSLLPGSPAIGTGPNGIDMGAVVPAGASIAGEPSVLTRQTEATLTVAGPGITHYKYRLNDGVLSDAAPVQQPVQLSDLSDGEYTVYVVGRTAAGVWQDEAEAVASKTWTVDTSLARLLINEVLAGNRSAVDHLGTFPDLIELYNDGPLPVDLAGMSISDHLDNPERFVFPAASATQKTRPAETTVPAFGYLLLYADAETETPGLHLGFGLDAEGDGVFLFAAEDNKARPLVDEVEFGVQIPDLSIGRTGHNRDWALTQPTFGDANVPVRTSDAATLKINEWLANGEVLLEEDFVELYNPAALPVSLSGLFLTDDPYAQRDKHEIPALSFIAADGFAVFTADESPLAGADHVGFRLSSEQEMIALYDAQLNEIDKVLYFSQTTDASEGRSGDGEDSFAFFSLPTPGLPNAGSNVLTVGQIALDDAWQYDQSGNDWETAWREVDFAPDPAWATGPGPLGDEDDWTDPGDPQINTPLVHDASMTFYFRKQFTLDADPEDVDLEITTLIDDGALFYINGVEVLPVAVVGGGRERLGMAQPGTPEGDSIDFETEADRTVGEADFEGPFSLPTDALVQGDNVIAVEVHQTNSNSSDVVFGLTLNATVTTWGAEIDQGLNLLGSLRVTEVMYHPSEDEDTEFIELHNAGDVVLDLTGVRLAGGIEFTFPPMLLAPEQYVVVVRDLEAFARQYGPGINVAGQYSGNLGNGGDAIVVELADPLDVAALRFEYDDAWYPTTDGGGFALEIGDVGAKPASWKEAESWQPGSLQQGTPGTADGQPSIDLVINEVLTHTDPPATDTIELHNTTDAAINVGGWYLSDSSDNYLKFRIPDGTTIDSFGYVAFDEHDFNPDPLDPGPNDFALDGAHGDEVFLVQAQGGKVTRVADFVVFGATANDESLGRWPDGAGSLYPMSQLTLEPAAENSGPRVGPVVINEIHYHPPVPIPNPLGLSSRQLEYVEIYNSGTVVESLDNWRIRGGIDFDFPAGLTLPERSVMLVVSFDVGNAQTLAAFLAHYGIDDSVPVVGGYTGELDDDGERVRLQRADEPPLDEQDFFPRLPEDEVTYDDELPWPDGPDGNGDSLHRVTGNGWGDDSASWLTGVPSPGAVEPGQRERIIGRYVFYNNSVYDTNNDDAAIAEDKQPLLPGQTAGFINYTSYSLGINGIMIDVAGLPVDAVLDADDFTFRVGNDGNPNGWTAPTAVPTVTVRRGVGAQGSDRVTLIWEDNTIRNHWLEVTVKANADTGLAAADVFYFGNAVGESGNSTDDARVNAADVLLARNNPHNLLNPAPIDFKCDYNRDSRVNATDMLIARSNQTHFLDALELISPPLEKAADGKAADGQSFEAKTSPNAPAWLCDEQWISGANRTTEKDGTAADALDAWMAAFGM